MSEELLQQGIAALKAGRRDEARRLLEQVVQEDPRSEQGWLWLSGAVDTDEERRFCLTQILSINPRNPLAQQGLEALGPGPVLSPVEGSVLSPARPEPLRRVEGPVRSPLAEPEQPPEQPAEEPPVTPAAGIICPRCDAVNPPGFRFCDQCGAPLDQPASVVEPLASASETVLSPVSSATIQSEQAVAGSAESKRRRISIPVILLFGCLLAACLAGGYLGIQRLSTLFTSSPTATMKRFFTAIDQGDIGGIDAMSSREANNMLSPYVSKQANTRPCQAPAFLDERKAGNTAWVTVQCSGESQQRVYTLVREDGNKWKVHTVERR